MLTDTDALHPECDNLKREVLCSLRRAYDKQAGQLTESSFAQAVKGLDTIMSSDINSQERSPRDEWRLDELTRQGLPVNLRLRDRDEHAEVCNDCAILLVPFILFVRVWVCLWTVASCERWSECVAVRQA
jgi:hypothetical protein